jgi:hypothetical protein
VPPSAAPPEELPDPELLELLPELDEPPDAPLEELVELLDVPVPPSPLSLGAASLSDVQAAIETHTVVTPKPRIAAVADIVRDLEGRKRRADRRAFCCIRRIVSRLAHSSNALRVLARRECRKACWSTVTFVRGRPSTAAISLRTEPPTRDLSARRQCQSGECMLPVCCSAYVPAIGFARVEGFSGANPR